MKKTHGLAGCLLAVMLAAGPALAEEVAAYRETQLGLYVTASEAYELMQDNDRAILIDVRDPVEIKFTGFAEPTDIHVPWVLADRDHFNADAKTWPMVKNADFEAQVRAELEALDVAEDDPIIVMCRSGSTRSAPGADVIAEMGFNRVYSVTDGFEGGKLEAGDSKGVRAVNGWRNSGLPWSYEIDPDVAWRPAE
ncbi:rhodanese-like domain-containing protein [Halomonas saccharevitans]|uniref:Rhodanese-like domain-containing protein n=1 Tax=Halomonas saccharevitans TaxID=416872 RepID=A0ABU3NEV7_9GAMM|nr:rhodanese-like domain-containing protein [Halomonas saccharevitans]MDT8879721.1 rhodanese-like domain-containing protein [Halomonas saccharevitans]